MKTSTLKLNYFLVIAICSLAYFKPLSAIAAAKSQQCLVVAKDLKTKASQTNFLFVDVRDKTIFAKKHIPGSINVSLQLINTKAFLKNKNMVLVGNGWNESSLIKNCKELKSKGFNSVQVLSGGILNWFTEQKRLRKNELVSLTSKEFFSIDSNKKFVPFVVSAQNKSQIKTTLPHAKIFSLKATKNQILKGLKNMGRGDNPIVLFSDDSTVSNAALNAYLKKPTRKIYSFIGGFLTYHQVNTLNKMTAASNQNKRLSTKKPVSCAN